MKTKSFVLGSIPDIHPANFAHYNSAAHTGHYLWLRIIGDVLEVDQAAKAEPVGKTTNERVLSSCQQGADVAIMFDIAGWGEVWFHLVIYPAAEPQPDDIGELIEPKGRR